MGTRADFYVGRGNNAEWLGSIGLDGYPSGIEPNILACTDEQIYRDFVSLFLKENDYSTLPENGWPWPWENSQLTDYSYAFDEGQVWASCFGHKWFLAAGDEPSDEEWGLGKIATFPDMTKVQNVTLGKRSGLMVFTS